MGWYPTGVQRRSGSYASPDRAATYGAHVHFCQQCQNRLLPTAAQSLWVRVIEVVPSAGTMESVVLRAELWRCTAECAAPVHRTTREWCLLAEARSFHHQ